MRANAANDSGAVASTRNRRRVTRTSAADGRRDAGSQPVSQIVASDVQLSNGTAPVLGASSSNSARAAASAPGSGNFDSVRKLGVIAWVPAGSARRDPSRGSSRTLSGSSS